MYVTIFAFIFGKGSIFSVIKKIIIIFVQYFLNHFDAISCEKETGILFVTIFKTFSHVLIQYNIGYCFLFFFVGEIYLFSNKLT